MAKIGYARESTRGQKDDSQVDDLTACGCDKLFTDKTSGKLAARPELDKALAYLRAGDVLVITRPSRRDAAAEAPARAGRPAARAQRRPSGPPAAHRHDHAGRAAGLPISSARSMSSRAS
jgi:hypothetical protein